jgi:hypothetical protein
LVETEGIRKNKPAIVAPREEEGSIAAAPPERRRIGEHCGRTSERRGRGEFHHLHFLSLGSLNARCRLLRRG